jgi:hypothetical protein
MLPWAANPQPKSQKLLSRLQATSHDRDFSQGDREIGSRARGENAFSDSEDRIRKYSSRERAGASRAGNGACSLAGASANPKIWARTTPGLPVNLGGARHAANQHDSSPKRSLGLALRRHASFCKRAAAKRFHTSLAANPQLSCRSCRATLGLPARHASGCFRAHDSCRVPARFTGRVEGQKVSEGLMARRAIRRATEPPDCRRQRVPPLLAFCLAFFPSDLPVKNLERAEWPGCAPAASAI